MHDTLTCSECFSRMPYWKHKKTECPKCGAVYWYKDNIDHHCCSFNMLLMSEKRIKRIKNDNS